ncbi:MAG: hypothetical protein HY051_00155 [Candidatus Aenigmarchaeota archaeon]|nr:hypothetical protein [Candidatus Aenigmarchaeota archaeon]
MRKGITPVIALVMLMLITVGVVGLAYAWFSGLASTQTEKGISIPPGGAKCYKLGGINYVSVAIQNNGAASNLLRTDFIVSTINGVDCSSHIATYFPAAGIAPGAGAIVFAGRGSAALCANGSAFSAGTYPVMIGTRTNVAQTQVICT